MTQEVINQGINSISKAQDQQKREKDLENLFEAEAEYVLDEIQKQAHQIFGEDVGSMSDCASEIGYRLAGIRPGVRGRQYWLRDMGVVMLQIMTVMEAHGYKISEEILEIMAQAREDHQEAAKFAQKTRLTS